MSDGCWRVCSIAGSPPSCLAEILGTHSASFINSSLRLYGCRTMLFQVSVMWCSKRTTFSKSRAFRNWLVISMVSLFTELLQLNPINGELPSSLENSLAVSRVHRAEYGLSFHMNTELLKSIST